LQQRADADFGLGAALLCLDACSELLPFDVLDVQICLSDAVCAMLSVASADLLLGCSCVFLGS